MNSYDPYESGIPAGGGAGQGRLRPVLRAAGAGFIEDVASFQLGLRHRPDLVVGARDSAGVGAVMRLAGEHGAPVAVHHTGHGMWFAADGGVVLTLR
jgi:hypothetical protein